MKLKVLKSTDPILRTSCQDLSLKELKLIKTQKLIEQLLDFVYGQSNKGKERNRNKASTVGLSANQLGISQKICIVNLGIGNKRYNDLHCLINPKITKYSKIKSEHVEGCVNLPELYGLVPRFKWVVIKTLDRSGNEIIIKAQGWLSVLLQHEIGHLNGELFIDHLLDPTKAHYVPEGMQGDTYRKNFKKWDKFKDVRSLVRQVKST